MSATLPVPMPLARSCWLALAMVVAAWLAHDLKPTRQMSAELPAIHLQDQVPTAFAGWTIDHTLIPVLPDLTLQAKLDSVYAETLARTYVNARGERVMLTIAYGSDQSSEATAVHRPEFCYSAQGFRVQARGIAHVPLGDATHTGQVTVQRLVGTLGRRVEPLSYWVTMADRATLPGFRRKWAQMRMGLAGFVADGMLVRVSTIGMSSTPYAVQDRFLQDLAHALPVDVRSRYFGD